MLLDMHVEERKKIDHLRITDRQGLNWRHELRLQPVDLHNHPRSLVFFICVILCKCSKDRVAEWSKAPVLGTGSKERGFEPHLDQCFALFFTPRVDRAREVKKAQASMKLVGALAEQRAKRSTVHQVEGIYSTLSRREGGIVQVESHPFVCFQGSSESRP